MRAERGFTLMELIVALFIGTVGLVAVFSFFSVQSRVAQSQERTAEVQQNVRIAMELVARDVRGAGFGLGDPTNAVRVEQQCGKNPLTPAGIKDGCPNGSDRILVHFRQVNTRLTNCPEAECSGQANNALMFREPDAICPFGGPSGNPCGASLHPTLSCGLDPNCGSNPPVITYCKPSGFPCTLAKVDRVQCDQDCGNPGPNGQCVKVSLCSNLPASFQDIKGGFGIDVLRVYQLLDVDGNGSTELVTSDSVVGSAVAVPTPSVASQVYQVLVENIDDFQIEVNAVSDPDFRTSDCSSQACWISRDVYRGSEDNDNDGDTDDSDFPFPNRSWRTYAGTAIRGACQDTTANEAANNNWGCAARVRGLRFSVAGRTASREIDGTRLLNVGFHPSLGDNAQSPDPFVSGTSPAGGAAYCYGTENCGCGGTTYADYLRCSGSGNAQGYRWRVLTNEVLLRNVRGLVAN